MKTVYLLIFGLLLSGVAGCTPKGEAYDCVKAAQEESVLTACEEAKNCRSAPDDYERFQRHTRECLQR